MYEQEIAEARADTQARTFNVSNVGLVAEHFPSVLPTLDAALSKSGGISDIHFEVGKRPWFREGATLYEVETSPAMSWEEMQALLIWVGGSEVSEVIAYPPQIRWRATTSRIADGFQCVLRIIAEVPPSPTELALPALAVEQISKHEGLIVVAGSTGSGKTSTLAALIQTVLDTQERSVLTIENPIEFKFKSNKGRVAQREIGRDVPDASTAMHTALRSDPDVVVLGEARSVEEIQFALQLAETGHLVLTTLHARDVSMVCSKIAAATGSLGRSTLAQVFRCSIAQRLLPDAKDKKVRHLAAEVMPITTAMALNIEPSGDLSKVRTFARDSGYENMDAVLARMVANELITEELALTQCMQRQDFTDKLTNALSKKRCGASRGGE